MNSIAFSKETLDEKQAREIAEAYIKGEKDPPKIASILGVDSFDLNLLMHPFVRKHIVEFQRSIRANYSLHDHIDKLKEIRDAAFDDENYKVALAAETQVGKAAGHYDPKIADDGVGKEVDPTKLSTEELRRRLAKSIGAVIPQDKEPTALPGEISSQESEDGGL